MKYFHESAQFKRRNSSGSLFPLLRRNPLTFHETLGETPAVRSAFDFNPCVIRTRPEMVYGRYIKPPFKADDFNGSRLLPMQISWPIILCPDRCPDLSSRSRVSFRPTIRLPPIRGSPPCHDKINAPTINSAETAPILPLHPSTSCAKTNNEISLLFFRVSTRIRDLNSKNR